MFATHVARVKTYNDIVRQLTYLPDEGLFAERKQVCLDILVDVHATPRQTFFDKYVLDLTDQQYAALRQGKELIKEYQKVNAQRSTIKTTMTTA